MTAGQTLHSRLRVLVAKAFRAEKLYSSSASNSTSSGFNNTGGFGMAGTSSFKGARSDSNFRGDRPNNFAVTNVAVIAEAAGDIRAKEWQRAHYQLRTALNEVLALGNQTAILREVVKLRDAFSLRSEESAAMVEKGSEELIETARRHEFAHIFKISLELIRLKAQAQSNRAIADELTAQLEASGLQTDRVRADAESIPVVIRRLDNLGDNSSGDNSSEDSLGEGNAAGASAESESHTADDDVDNINRSNVIEFRARAGQRYRRR